MNFSKPHKYKVASKERRTADGITFDSMAEMNRYLELKVLEKSGAITNLGLQPKFLLIFSLSKTRQELQNMRSCRLIFFKL